MMAMSRLQRPLQAAPTSTSSPHIARTYLSIAAKHAGLRRSPRPLLDSAGAAVRKLAAQAGAARTIAAPAAAAAAPAAAPPPEAAAPHTLSLQQRVGELLRGAAKSAALVGLAAALLLSGANPAHAARTAGRAGGFSAPPPAASRSYGGGGGSSGFSSRGYSGGGSIYSSPGYYRSPIIVPSPPIVLPTPGYYGGYGAGGLMAAPAVVSTGPGIVDIAIVSMFLVMAATAATSALRSTDLDSDDEDGYSSGLRAPTLTRVQVGLLASARGLKRDLDAIAARADTGSSRGLHALLQEVALALLRNPSYSVYGAASQKACGSAASLEAAFNAASLKERSKFEAGETLANVGGAGVRRAAAPYRPPAGGSKPDELVVVTLLVATGSKVKLPPAIRGLADLQDVLSALGGLPADEVLGVELLWTPQAEGDFFTLNEAIAEYPNLRQL